MHANYLHMWWAKRNVIIKCKTSGPTIHSKTQQFKPKCSKKKEKREDTAKKEKKKGRWRRSQKRRDVRWETWRRRRTRRRERLLLSTETLATDRSQIEEFRRTPLAEDRGGGQYLGEQSHVGWVSYRRASAAGDETSKRLLDLRDEREGGGGERERESFRYGEEWGTGEERGREIWLYLITKDINVLLFKFIGMGLDKRFSLEWGLCLLFLTKWAFSLIKISLHGNL